MPYVLRIKINGGDKKYFGTFATKEEMDKKREEVRKQHPKLQVGAKKGVKNPKVKCPSCSTQISIHRVSDHYKACKQKRG